MKKEVKPILFIRDRSKITWYNLSVKVLKNPNIFLTEHQVILEPTFNKAIRFDHSFFLLTQPCGFALLQTKPHG